MPDGSPAVTTWRTALPDWEERIKAGGSLIPPDLKINEAEADKALRIFKRLRVPDLIGRPTYGEVCENWVFDLVRVIFGALDTETMRRAVQEFFLLVPKKNGKSSTAAAIIVTAAVLNARPEAELILIAPTKEISSIAFKQARGIIDLDPVLKKIFKVQAHTKVIRREEPFPCEIKVLAADGDIVTGSKAAYILIDETHVLGAKPKAADIFLELRGGLASRPEGFLLQITTQSKEPPVGQFRKELMRARAVRDGLADQRMMPILYELPRDMQQSGLWKDPATWHLVNPNLERSVPIEYLAEEYAKAEIDGPDALALFASQHLNVEVGIGLHSDRWVGADFWPDCLEDGLTLEVLLERSEVAIAGADMGGADDLASLVVMGRDAETKKRLVWGRAWCTKKVLERRKEIAPRLKDFEADGDLIIDDDPVGHIADMVKICSDVQAAGLMPDAAAIGLDPWGVAALVDALLAAGFAEDQILGVNQGYKLNGSIKGTERRLLDGSLVHGGQPLMTWAVGNAKAEARGNNTLITKATAGSAKIDPLIALFNAGILMDMNPTPAAPATPWDTDPGFRLARRA